MSKLDATFDQAIDDAYGEMSDDATFLPEGGDSEICSVIFEKEIDQMPVGFNAGGMDYLTTIEVRNSEVSRLPERGDIFTIDSVQYYVDGIIEGASDERVTKCVVRVVS